MIQQCRMDMITRTGVTIIESGGRQRGGGVGGVDEAEETIRQSVEMGERRVGVMRSRGRRSSKRMIVVWMVRGECIELFGYILSLSTLCLRLMMGVHSVK
jgi:hypothetical protein